MSIRNCTRLIFFLFLSVLCVHLNGQALPLDVLDTADVNYTAYTSNLGGGIAGIADTASLGPGGGGDHFDDAFGVTVDGVGYSPLNGVFDGGSLQLESQLIGQYDVSVNMASVGAVMRQIVSITNTGIAGTASFQWHNNTGNDGAQQTIGTSNGDLLVGTSDRWVVTADSTTGDDNEVNSWILFGNGGMAPSFVDTVDGSATFGGAGEQGLTAIYDLALAPGETASLLLFVGVEGINQDGLDLAAAFDDQSSAFFQGLIADLSPAERNRIVNYSLVVPEPSTAVLLAMGLVCARLRRVR